MTQAPESVIVSSFLRTVETARPILLKFQRARLVTLPVHEFTYLSSDRCRFTTFDDRREMVKEFWDRADPTYVDGPGAESFDQFRERVGNCVRTIARSGDRYVLVISHALVMQMIRAAALAGSFDAVSMADFRNLMTSRPIANLEVLETRLDEHSVTEMRHVS